MNRRTRFVLLLLLALAGIITGIIALSLGQATAIFPTVGFVIIAMLRILANNQTRPHPTDQQGIPSNETAPLQIGLHISERVIMAVAFVVLAVLLFSILVVLNHGLSILIILIIGAILGGSWIALAFWNQRRTASAGRRIQTIRSR
jgi:hypothetical protein